MMSRRDLIKIKVFSLNIALQKVLYNIPAIFILGQHNINVYWREKRLSVQSKIMSNVFTSRMLFTLLWRNNGRGSVSNH